MRAYEQSHSWITFKLDLSKATRPKLWLLLGEVKSKCEHLSGVPMRPDVAKRLHELYLAKGVAATTAIEGNTLSEDEVLQKIRGTLVLPQSQRYLEQEVSNLLSLCKVVTRAANRSRLKPLSSEIICNHNKLILRNLPLEEGVVPGEVTHAVVVAGYRGAPREDCKFLLAELCSWLNGKSFEHEDLPPMPMVRGILKAVLAHLYLAWIHPFGDGNGRTARLIEFRLLLQAGVPSPAAHLLSNHYNQTRSEYYRQLSYSSKSGGRILPFLIYALEGFLDGLKSQLLLIREQQFDVTWRSLIFNAFKDRNAKNDLRRRALIFEVSKQGTFIEADTLKMLNPTLAKEYARLSERTFWRDLDELQSMGLLVSSEDRKSVRAHKEIISAFLPAGKTDGPDWRIASTRGSSGKLQVRSE